jgi:hypothetical protein
MIPAEARLSMLLPPFMWKSLPPLGRLLSLLCSSRLTALPSLRVTVSSMRPDRPVSSSSKACDPADRMLLQQAERPAASTS